MEGRHDKLLFTLCTTMSGSKYIQDCLQAMMNHNSSYVYNGNDNNFNNSGHVGCVSHNTSEMKSIIFDFFHEISSFGHILCIDKYGHYAIDKFLTTCYQLNVVNVLENFIKHIIVKNFSTLMQHSYPCRIVQDMLNSHSYQLKIYVLTQLNSLFNPQPQKPQKSQQEQQQFRQDECKTAMIVNGSYPSAMMTQQKNGENYQNIKNVASNHVGKFTIGTQIDGQATTGTSDGQLNGAHFGGDSRNGNSSSSNYNNIKHHMLYDTINHHIGNYIIQAMIETACKLNIVNDILSYLLNFVSNYGSSLACNRFGCRVVQCCIVSKNVSCSNKCRLFANLFESLAVLCNHQYGNYCIQKCIEYGGYQIRELFVEHIFFAINLNVKNFSNSTLFNARYTLPNALRTSFENYMSNVQNPNTIINFSKFSFGKYSSIVCDTAFKYATDDQRASLIAYLSNPNISIKYNVLFGLVHHEYGNFVIKNVIKTLVNLHENAINEFNNCNNHDHHDSQQRAQNYLASFNKMKQSLNNVFEFISKYHCQNKFSFAHNISQLADVHGHKFIMPIQM